MQTRKKRFYRWLTFPAAAILDSWFRPKISPEMVSTFLLDILEVSYVPLRCLDTEICFGPKIQYGCRPPSWIRGIRWILFQILKFGNLIYLHTKKEKIAIEMYNLWTILICYGWLYLPAAVHHLGLGDPANSISDSETWRPYLSSCKKEKKTSSKWTIFGQF